MSQYFTAPRHLSTTRSEPLSSPIDVPDIDTDIDRSIYIFPNPSLGLASPGLSSFDGSTPTDVSLSSDIASGRSRRGSSLLSRMSWDEFSSGSSRPRRSSVATGVGSDAEVEIWEWPGDENDTSDDVTDQELEAAVERANRWEHLPRRSLVEPFALNYAQSAMRYRRPLRAPSSSFLSWDGGNRTRTLSNLSRTSSRPGPAPLPRPFFRIPFISFFASLLSLDESTLHLITRPTLPASSPLFNSPALSIHEEETLLSDEKLHGVAKFCESGTKSLQEGISYACDPSVTPFNPFALHVPSLPGLPRVLSEVTSISRKAFNEAWRPHQELAAMS